MRQHYLATLPGFGSPPREEGMVHRDKNARTVPSFCFVFFEFRKPPVVSGSSFYRPRLRHFPCIPCKLNWFSQNPRSPAFPQSFASVEPVSLAVLFSLHGGSYDFSAGGSSVPGA